MTCRIRYSMLPAELRQHAKHIRLRYPNLAAHLLDVSKAISLAELGADEKDVMDKINP